LQKAPLDITAQYGASIGTQLKIASRWPEVIPLARHSMVMFELIKLKNTSVMALTHRVSANGIVYKTQLNV